MRWTYPVSTPTGVPKGWDTPAVAEKASVPNRIPCQFRTQRVPNSTPNTYRNGWIFRLAPG